MFLTIESIEEVLRASFQQQVVDPGIQNPTAFLQRWFYLSSQVPRLHGAALARVKIPEIQALLAVIAHGECGSGDSSQIHSKLLSHLISQAPCAEAITHHLNLDAVHIFEEAVETLSQMNQDQAIGFIVGLEAPAYEILQLLEHAFVEVGISHSTVLESDYMIIHNAVEKEHQESGFEAMSIVLDSGCNLQDIYMGGETAIRFLVKMVGQTSVAPELVCQ